MRRASVCATVVVFLCLLPAGGRGAVSAAATRDGDVFVSGQIVIESDATGRTTVVTVDVDSAQWPADGRAEHAFRVQQPRKLVTYRGTGTLFFRKGRLYAALPTMPGLMLAYTVSPADVNDPAADVISAAGLAHFWGAGVSGTAEEVRARLLGGSAGAATVMSEPGCDRCDEGGPGSTYCEPPGGGSCSASCADGYYACCNGPSDCRCCAAGASRPGTCAAPLAPAR